MKIFTKKNFYTFCLIFTVITICLSIYNLFVGHAYDSMGYFHELYRAIILLIALMILYYLRHLPFKRSIIDSLLEMWPLLAALGLLLLLKYLDGSIGLNTIKKYLLYGLLALLGLFLLAILLNTLSKTIASILKGSKKLSLSFVGLFFVLIMLLPLLLLPELKSFEEVLASFKGPLYIIAFVFLLLACITALLVSDYRIKIGPLSICFIVVYYVVWLIVLLSEISLTALVILLVSFFVPWLIYSISNRLHYSWLFCFVFIVLEIVAMSISL